MPFKTWEKCGVVLNNNGTHGFDSDTSTLEQVRARIKAHGSLTGEETKTDDMLHYYLWRDAGRLLRLLDAANRKIADLERGRGTSLDKSVKSLGEVVASLQISCFSKEYVLDVPVELLMRAK